ncbi:MAG: oligoendopeptidase F, partial [Campylobacter hyointestinalis]
LFGLYKSGKCEDFVRIYTEFLSLGGSKSPKDMVAMFGFDINKEEFWDIGMNEIKKLVDEFIVI